MYLSQFNLLIKHKARREHIIPDALLQLPTKNSAAMQQEPEKAPDIEAYNYDSTLTELSNSFRAELIEAYKEREWAFI